MYEKSGFLELEFWVDFKVCGFEFIVVYILVKRLGNVLELGFIFFVLGNLGRFYKGSDILVGF